MRSKENLELPKDPRLMMLKLFPVRSLSFSPALREKVGEGPADWLGEL